MSAPALAVMRPVRTLMKLTDGASMINIVVPQEIRDYFAGRHTQGQGGFQTLGRMLQERLANSRTLRVTPEEFARIVHYARNYGDGGYQTRLRMIIVEFVAQHQDVLFK